MSGDSTLSSHKTLRQKIWYTVHKPRIQAAEANSSYVSINLAKVIRAVILLQVVRDHYGHFARKEATLRVSFKCSEITLDIPDDGLVTREGWRITPLSFPTVSG